MAGEVFVTHFHLSDGLFSHHASVAFNALHVMQFLFLGIELKLKLDYKASLLFMLSGTLARLRSGHNLLLAHLILQAYVCKHWLLTALSKFVSSPLPPPPGPPALIQSPVLHVWCCLSNRQLFCHFSGAVSHRGETDQRALGLRD